MQTFTRFRAPFIKIEMRLQEKYAWVFSSFTMRAKLNNRDTFRGKHDKKMHGLSTLCVLRSNQMGVNIPPCKHLVFSIQVAHTHSMAYIIFMRR